MGRSEDRASSRAVTRLGCAVERCERRPTGVVPLRLFGEPLRLYTCPRHHHEVADRVLTYGALSAMLDAPPDQRTTQ